ncbi:MAG: phosphodiester glycosidase family protein [Hyphomicrobiales bacterium]
MRWPTALCVTFAVWTGSTTAAEAGCASEEHAGLPYAVCRFAPDAEITLYNLDAGGVPFGSFTALAQSLAATGRKLTFAMNAGMFDDKLKPIGLYVENGETRKKINRKNGYGNFHLKPNGVFFTEGGKAFVQETEAYVKAGHKPDFATQSGPMLVVNGKLHPKFSETGTSAKVRNGVGVTDDGTVVFVLSEWPVTFHDFAALFRDELKTQNALFLDGTISSLYSTELGRNDGFRPLGPMVAVTEKE